MAKGNSLTSSEYIWIAESDDYADSGLLSCLIARLDAHPRAGLAVCDSVNVDEATMSWVFMVAISGLAAGRGLRVSSHRREFRGARARLLRDYMVPGTRFPMRARFFSEGRPWWRAAVR